MKQKIKNFLNARAFLPLRRAIFGGRAVIFMLHRIAPLDPAKLAPNENMKVSPRFLEDFIAKMRGLGWRFISLDDLAEGLECGSLAPKSALITIDDGYKDNFTHGFPLFSHLKVPFCTYLCTSFLEKTADMWWFGLEDFLLSRESMGFCGESLPLKTKEEKEAAFLRIREVLMREIRGYGDAREVFARAGIDYDPSRYADLALGCDEIYAMQRATYTPEASECGDNYGGGGQRGLEPRSLERRSSHEPRKLFTLGHHTHFHPVFNNLSDHDIKRDIERASAIFAERFGEIPRHFAYPFGTRAEVSAAHFGLIKSLGFKTAVTTRRGSIYPAHKAHLHALPRIFLTESFALESLYNFRTARVTTA